MKTKSLLLSTLVLLGGLHTGLSQSLFTENFDTDPTANWAVFRAGSDSFVDFNFDYSTLGIPAAPNSAPGSTRGARFLVNQSANGNVLQGISASPLNQGFVGNYRLRFDMWLNFNGPFPGGGNGSTQCGTFGVGATGGNAQTLVANPNAIMFGVTADGGSTQDYRCYSNNTHMAFASGVYAGTNNSPDVRNDTNPHYAGLGGKTAPAAQLTLFSQQTGTTATGAAGMAWRDVIVDKIGDSVSWRIDGKLIATCQTPPTFSSNIFIGMFDINTNSSSDINDHLIASIFDNIRVESLGTSVSVAATAANAKEGAANGEFTITRSGSTIGSLTVGIALTGSASNGVDYPTIPLSVEFADGQTTATVSIPPTDDSIAELPETVVLTISASANYAVSGAPATVSIADNEPAELSIAPLASTMYERVVGDYVSYTVTRKGNVDDFLSATISYSGTAGAGRYTPTAAVDINPGASTGTFQVSGLDDTLLNGNQTIIATIDAGTGYTVGTPASATATIIDDENPTEAPVFADALSTDTSSQWTVRFGANNLVEDYSANFGYALADDGIPNAPNGSGTALKVTVNKADPTVNGAAGLNLYPNSQSFSGDFAMRFDMYIQQNSSVGTTEFVLFGINHSGLKTNWVWQTGNTTYNNPPKDCDGLWFSVISDASASAPGDYTLITGTNAAGGPILLQSASAASFTQVYKRPPYTQGVSAGVPGNLPSSGTKNWADVEVKKVGNVVTMSINKTTVLQYTNTTAYTSGNIMLGYMDSYESIGSTGGAAYFSNLRVIPLGTTVQAPSVTGIQLVNGNANVQIDFTGAASDSANAFTLQSSATVDGTYSNTAATLISTGTGTFRATAPVNGATRFYRISR